MLIFFEQSLIGGIQKRLTISSLPRSDLSAAYMAHTEGQSTGHASHVPAVENAVPGKVKTHRTQLLLLLQLPLGAQGQRTFS